MKTWFSEIGLRKLGQANQIQQTFGKFGASALCATTRTWIRALCLV